MMFNGYEEAEKIDKQLNALLNEHKVSADNFREWMKFSRTLQTSLKLLNHEIEEVSGIAVEI